MQNEIEFFKLIYLNGKKINQSDVFSFNGCDEITFGRSGHNRIIIEPDNKIVSREHAKITKHLSKDNLWSFQIEDLNSTNGTFVNNTRLRESKPLYPGDVIRFGENGPEIKFTIEPIPSYFSEPTTFVDEEVTDIFDKSIISKPKTPRISLIISLLVGVGLILASIYYTSLKPANVTKESFAVSAVSDSLSSDLTFSEIIEKNKNSIVNIEFEWHLIDNSYNDELWHVYQYDSSKDKYLPIFVESKNIFIPVLLQKSKRPFGIPVRMKGSGTGFIIDSSGYIMSCIHVTSGWKVHYTFEEKEGILVDNRGEKIKNIYTSDVNWIPESTSNSKGENINLDVVLNNEDNRRPATQVGNSNDHDVSIIKVSNLNKLQSVNFASSSDSIKIGEDIVLIAYPGSSPKKFKPQRSHSPLGGTGVNISTIPSVSVFKGLISKIFVDNSVSMNLFTDNKDFYQLDINNPGGGCSGGPIFNKYGNVVGICFAEYNSLTLAIPVKYGISLKNIY